MRRSFKDVLFRIIGRKKAFWHEMRVEFYIWLCLPLHTYMQIQIYTLSCMVKTFLVFNNPRSQLSDSVYLLHFNFFYSRSNVERKQDKREAKNKRENFYYQREKKLNEVSGERGEGKENIAHVEDEGFQNLLNCNNDEKILFCEI